MSGDAWLTLGVVAVVLAGLVRNLAPPDLLFLGATAVLATAGVITTDEAFAGFSNSGMLTVAMLFVVAAGLRETGVLDHVGHWMLGRAKTERDVVVRMALIVLPMSAFLNNTPIVAMFLPVVLDWCRQHEVAPSKLLIPLSFLTILGGTCTLIGTSTNLVVHGLMIENGMEGLGLFEIGLVGLPYAVIGFVWLYVAGPKILPERKELAEQLGETRREFLVEMLVQPRCRLVGQTVEQAGLRHLPGLFLIEIDRDSGTVAPAGPDDVIAAGDRLVFTGVVSSIIELEKIPGLVPTADPDYDVAPRQQRRRRMCEAVVSNSSPLIGKTIRDAEFRAAYGAAVVAVHRGGRRIARKIGDIRLRAGDTLLLQVRSHFIRTHRNDPAFYLVSDVGEWRPLRRDRAWLALGVLVALIVLMTTGAVSTLLAATLAAVAMVGFGCISSGDARQSIEWQVLVTIAAAFGVGAALENSGAAAAIAGAVVEATRGWGAVAAIAAVYLVGSLMTAVITNNAAAVLLFPFCLETAKQLGVSPRPFLIALILSASASFITPVGYQTNTMVYGPGGYRFSDFLRIGGPLNFVLWVVAILLIQVFWPF
ncbi:MAG: anion permease [Planctomycetes bacterium]|nr:anion permease [Planctomycetota bacterium]